MAQLPEVGFIGTGVMGASMAGHLLRAGYPLRVFNRTPGKAGALIEAGALWADSVAEVAARSEIVFTILGFPEDVCAVYLDPDGLINSMNPGTLLVDMTTSEPELAVRIEEAAVDKDGDALDAPVSGGEIGAREGRLSIMAGGRLCAFEKAKPLFACMGKTIVHQGGPGKGQHCKMVNQIAIAAGMLGVCEAVAYAREAGLDASQVLSSIEHGAAGSWSLSHLAPRMIRGDYAPGFYVKHFLKDLRIALEAARKLELSLPGLSRAHELYQLLSEKGYGEEGTQALFRLYQNSR